MEQKDIQFNKGIHRAPSIEAQDGELSECVNLIPKNGELVNVKSPEEIGISLGENEVLLAIHDVSEEKHYITKNKVTVDSAEVNRICWRSESDKDTCRITEASADNINQVVVIGNSLSLLYEQSKLIPMKYLLWKSNNDDYIFLEKIPDVKIDFSLNGDFYAKSYPNSVEFEQIEDTSSTGIFTEPVCTLATEEGYEYDHGIRIVPKGTEIPSEQKYYTFYFEDLGLELDKLYQISNGSTRELQVVYIHEENIETQSASIDKIGVNDRATVKFVTKYLTLGYSSLPNENLSATFYKSASDVSEKTWVLKDDGTSDSNFTAMMGVSKDFIQNVYKDKNQFLFPFFVRYGIKMFDGSYCHLSEPVYMLPNNGIVPFMLKSGESTVSLMGLTASLYIKATVSEDITKWEDIITGITIAITSPIYRFNEGEEYNKYKVAGVTKDYTEESLADNYGIINGEKLQIYSKMSSYSGSFIYFPPSFTKAQYRDNMKSASLFYEAKTYTIAEIIKITQPTSVDFSSISIENIETLPKVSDDYNSAQSFFPNKAFAYNNRLNIYNVTSLLAQPNTCISPILETSETLNYRCIFYISNMDKESIVKSEWTTNIPYTRWIYYGDANAKKCRVCKRIEVQSAEGKFLYYWYLYSDVDLSPHPWLNGSYAIVEEELPFTTTTSKQDYDPDTVIENNLISNNNAIYASNTSNPFYFPVSGQSKIGTGRIKTVSTSAKALSEGQFGQFPLYAFATDGIWALSVSSEGTYETSNPVNRDVVNDNADVCQIDDSVIYACSQGLKRLSGSEAQIISAAIDGDNVDEKTFLGYIDEKREYHGTMDELHKELTVPDTNTMINMLENCRIMYDPAGGRRLHIYPTSAGSKEATGEKHYIYDIESGEWTTYVGKESEVSAIVPGYPYSVIQNSDNVLRNYTNTENNSEIRYGVLLTRAMEFGNPFVMKMLCDLKMIYTKRSTDSKCKIAVFVSNDRVNWKQLTSLRKHSYKWYRFRIQTALTDLDALTAVSCVIDTRRDNKLR